MKNLILILALMISLQADKILISGLSHHSEKTNKDGVEVNPYNYGIGYQKDLDNGNTITSLVFSDSFKNTMYSVAYGFKWNSNIKSFKITYGAEFGLGYKKIIELGEFSYNYKIIPIAFVPSISVSKDRWSIDMVHIPEIDYKDFHVMSATLFLIGYKI